ncbi:dephospho-CoA kinase [Pleionea sediminis]|uniref:dephospho-CoA kinase n=1 Tax=Pleionea sediminis TaxID=2569479 RepID=UPI0011860111|nr:dephospho-CoA kinase [Pleionea sediminis]
MFKVGLTGGIGSGKSTVSNLFRLKNIDVIDADKIARDVVAKGSQALKEIEDRFGSDLILDSGELNREKLKVQVFNNSSDLNWLNQCLHPKIRAIIETKVQSSKSHYVILDIPLLFENKLEGLVDRILVVDVPEAIQQQRVMDRDGCNRELVESIIKKQVSRDYRLSHADDIIDNSHSLDNLKKAVSTLHQKYRVLSENG